MSICEIVRARAAAHSSVLRMALDDVGRALLRVGTVARNTRLLRRSYRVFRRVSRVGVLSVPCMGGRRLSYRIECHTLLSTAYAHNTRAAAIVSHIQFPNYSERSPLSDALARVSHYCIECHTLSYRMLYRMSHTNLHGIRA